MNDDRIHAFLDGELTRDALSAGELARATELQRHIDAAAGVVRSAPVPDLAARVMDRLPERTPAASPKASAVAGAVSWLWGRRTISFEWRPAYAAAASFALVLLFLIGLPGGDTAPPLPGTAESAGPQPTIYVQFRLDAPGAQRVELAGSFTDWAPAHQLHETGAGVWTVVVPLEPGVHDYTFVIDGERWIVDPNAPSVEDDFGGSNSRLFLPAPVQGV